MPGTIDHSLVNRLQNLKGLSWISDAPLFIDHCLVEQFFDAIVRPAYEHESTTEAEEKTRNLSFKAAVEAAAKVELDKPTWIPDWLFPLKGELSGNASLEGAGDRSKSSSTVRQLKPIWNAERQLEELTRHYFQFHPSRLLVNLRPFEEDGFKEDWSLFNADPEFFTEVPRALAFLDLEASTTIIPIAAEFEDGTVSRLYEELARKLTTEDGGPKQVYPDAANISPEDLPQKRKEYWESYKNHYSATQAMLVIEEASKRHNRIRWIDFRVPIGENGETLHLHVVPRGKSDAGVFGYNFVRRAFKHGVRMVGTLKSEPDMNVIAIYDK